MSKLYKNVFMFVLFVSAVYCQDDCPPCACKEYYGWTIDCTAETIDLLKIGQLTSVPRVNFSKVVNFDEITIKKQLLKHLSANEFQNAGLTSLKDIIINHCEINSVHEEAFNNLTNLGFLDLSFNNISKLSDNTFKPIKRIKNIRLNHNKLKSINNIIFADLTNLGTLEISNNLLTTFNENALLNNRMLQQLHLSHNKLTYLNIKIIKTIKSLYMLKIVGNPWTCNCFIEDLFEFMKNKSVTNSNYRLEFKKTKCRTPLSSDSWIGMEKNDFKCWLNATAIMKKSNAVRGDSVILSCLVDSNTLPNEIWTFNNKIINKANNKYHINKIPLDSVLYWFNLTILDLSKEDEGYYKCILTNNITQQMSEEKIELLVENRPISIIFIVIIVALMFFALGCTVILIKCAIKCSINNNIQDQPAFEDNFKLDEVSGRFSKSGKS